MRKSTLYLGLTAITGGLLFGLMVVWPIATAQDRLQSREANRRLVRELRLTDLCLFTEARYTRHPSQADLHSAFQDHPLSFEHFPSGSMVAPPLFGRENDR